MHTVGMSSCLPIFGFRVLDLKCTQQQKWRLFLRVINNIIWCISYDASMPPEVILEETTSEETVVADVVAVQSWVSWEFLIFSHMSLRHRDSPCDSVILSGGEGLDREWFKWDSCQRQSWLECVISWLLPLQHLQRRETLFSNRCTVPTERLSSRVWLFWIYFHPVHHHLLCKKKSCSVAWHVIYRNLKKRKGPVEVRHQCC